MTEDQLQIACLDWVRLHKPELAARLFHVPNGAKRAVQTRVKLKRMGLVAGVPDLGLLLPNGRISWIELKTAKGRVSPAQKEYHALLKQLGHEVQVVRSLNDFLLWIKNY